MKNKRLTLFILGIGLVFSMLSGCNTHTNEEIENLNKELSEVMNKYNNQVEYNNIKQSEVKDLKSQIERQNNQLLEKDDLFNQYVQEFEKYNNCNDEIRPITSAEDFFNIDLPLIYYLPEHDIRLYGCHPFGLILYVSDYAYYLDVAYMTPRFIMPEIHVEDFDDDGEIEIALITYIGSGSGVSIEKLYMIEMKKSFNPELENNLNESMDLIKFEQDNIDDLLDTIKIYANYESGYLEVKSLDYYDEIPLRDLYPDYKKDEFENELRYGNIEQYTIDNGKVILTLGIGISSKTFVYPIHFSNVLIDLEYSDGKFEIVDMKVVREIF